MNEDLRRAVDSFRAWCAETRVVSRVYFYGSRVWGNPKQHSDLDVLIVAAPGVVIFEKDGWTVQLSKILQFKVDVNDWFTADPALIEKIKREGYLVFSRSGNDSDFVYEDTLDDIDPSLDCSR